MLDILPPADPRAVRCRRDLKLINWLLGNHRWLLQALHSNFKQLAGGVVELGAGDGTFLHRLHRRHPNLRLAGFDHAPRPADLPSDVAWRSGNVFQHEGPWPGTVIVANLFLHHFTVEQLQAIGRRLEGVRMLLVGEGHRDPNVMRRSGWLNPLLGEVTRHDMEISLAAGFVVGELPEWLGLSDRDWIVTESLNMFGALRLLAIRREQ